VWGSVSGLFDVAKRPRKRSMAKWRLTKNMLTLTVLACSGATEPASVARVDVTPPNITLTGGESASLTATIYDEKENVLTNRLITWRSLDTSVAKVSASGLVAAVPNRENISKTVSITAESENRSGQSTITVPPASPAKISISNTASVRIVSGKSLQLEAQIYDSRDIQLLNRPIIWTSSNSGVAQISSTGMVVAKSPGSASISATHGALSTSVLVEVVARIASVRITLSGNKILVGQEIELTAVPLDSNSIVLGGRGVATWTVSDTSVATVTESQGQTTRLKGKKEGTVSVNARYEETAASIALNVQTPGPGDLDVTWQPDLFFPQGATTGDIIAMRLIRNKVIVMANKVFGATATKIKAIWQPGITDPDGGGVIDREFDIYQQSEMNTFSSTLTGLASCDQGDLDGIWIAGAFSGRLKRLSITGAIDSRFSGLPSNITGAPSSIILANTNCQGMLMTGISRIGTTVNTSTIAGMNRSYNLVPSDFPVPVSGIFGANTYNNHTINIFYSGSFSNVNGRLINGLWTNTTLPDGFGPTIKTEDGRTIPGAVTNIAYQESDGHVIIVGQFDHFSGEPARNIVRLNRYTLAVDKTFNTGQGPNGPVYDVVVTESCGPPRIFIAGNFSQVDGSPIKYFAALTYSGNIDQTFKQNRPDLRMGDGPDSWVRRMEKSSCNLFLAGSFQSYNGIRTGALIRIRIN
jgi:Bacterial Ig-like domain (group 2)/Domain of unknown function (DUF5122) beta-propeller